MKKKTVTALVPFDEAKALARVRVIESEVAHTVKTIDEDTEPLEITDGDDFKVASTELIKVILKREEVEENLGLFMADVQKLVDRVNGWFEKPRADIARAEEYFRAAIKSYAKRLNDEAHVMRETATKLDEDAAAELLTVANEHKPEKVPGITLIAEVAYTITDEAKIPAKYFKRVLNKKMLEADVEANIKIPGVTVSGVDFGLRVTPKNAKLGGA